MLQKKIPQPCLMSVVTFLYESCLKFLNYNYAAWLTPFCLIFKTNADEPTFNAAAIVTAPDATTSDLAFFPTGTVGFSLNYLQIACA